MSSLYESGATDAIKSSWFNEGRKGRTSERIARINRIFSKISYFDRFFGVIININARSSILINFMRRVPTPRLVDATLITHEIKV